MSPLRQRSHPIQEGTNRRRNIRHVSLEQVHVVRFDFHGFEVAKKAWKTAIRIEQRPSPSGRIDEEGFAVEGLGRYAATAACRVLLTSSRRDLAKASGLASITAWIRAALCPVRLDELRRQARLEKKRCDLLVGSRVDQNEPGDRFAGGDKLLRYFVRDQ